MLFKSFPARIYWVDFSNWFIDQSIVKLCDHKYQWGSKITCSLWLEHLQCTRAWISFIALCLEDRLFLCLYILSSAFKFLLNVSHKCFSLSHYLLLRVLALHHCNWFFHECVPWRERLFDCVHPKSVMWDCMNGVFTEVCPDNNKIYIQLTPYFALLLFTNVLPWIRIQMQERLFALKCFMNRSDGVPQMIFQVPDFTWSPHLSKSMGGLKHWWKGCAVTIYTFERTSKIPSTLHHFWQHVCCAGWRKVYLRNRSHGFVSHFGNYTSVQLTFIFWFSVRFNFYHFSLLSNVFVAILIWALFTRSCMNRFSG